MPGETKADVSGWTVDTLKALEDERHRHAREVRVLEHEYFKMLKDERYAHLTQLRDADLRASALVEKFNESHFAQLNENAKRTIEERGHFVSVEAFDPFRRRVETWMATYEGRGGGLNSGWNILVQVLPWIVAAVGIVIATRP